ncbi:MAG TPA: sterol desaturase family protein [Caulobacteraceae bacterium]|nr:sterol desaturase family protein [Caulobacteraceae bacterium]
MAAFFAAHQHVYGLLLQFARMLFWLVVLTAVFVPLEQFFAVRPTKLFAKGWQTNLAWYFIGGLVPVFLLGPPAALIAFVAHAVIPASFTSYVAALPLWARMVAAMVVGELGFYWGHRWTHEIPLLWRFHAVHHSAEHVNYLVNTRAHPVDGAFTRLCGLVLLYATGLASPVGDHPTFIPAMVLLVGSLWSYFIHANLRVRLGPLEEVISSPAFHHWHHTRNDHRDHNYASMLPFWDRVFGTFYLPRAWPAEYGTDTPVAENIVGQLLDPFLAAPPARRDQPQSPRRTA